MQILRRINQPVGMISVEKLDSWYATSIVESKKTGLVTITWSKDRRKSQVFEDFDDYFIPQLQKFYRNRVTLSCLTIKPMVNSPSITPWGFQLP